MTFAPHVPLHLALVVVFFVGACSSSTPPVEPELEQPTQIVIGEVSSTDDPAGPGAAEVLRDTLRRGALELEQSLNLEREMVLVGGVSQIERSNSSGGLVIRVTVSVALRDRAEGQILAMLESTAQACGPMPSTEGEPHDLIGMVVEGAALDALSRLGSRIEEL